jgi:SAM-dependent methyltransferase
MAEHSIQHLYETSNSVVRASFGSDRSQAFEFYKSLIDFVRGVAPPGIPRPRLLDVGCGCGWSTAAFAEAGYEATGMDLNPNAFEPSPSEHFSFQAGSAMEIPFPDSSFDVVVTYQCLEHVPSPEKALDEMARVCKPGGSVFVVGPNLVTPFPPIAYLAKPSSWKGMPLVRKPGVPRHPFGNTPVENVGAVFVRSFQLLAKLARRRPDFTMREPDDTPPFHSDNDACYLCNPTDLIAYFRSRGYQILRRGKPGRPPLSYLFAGGTWVAARKPG